MKEGDRIEWKRPFGKTKRLKTSTGEFFRNIKGRKNVKIILDGRFYPNTVPAGEVKAV